MGPCLRDEPTPAAVGRRRRTRGGDHACAPRHPRPQSAAAVGPRPWPAPAAGGPVQATVTVPGSKSVTNRALLLAALADGESTLSQPLRSRDTDLMTAGLRAMGAEVSHAGDRL